MLHTLLRSRENRILLALGCALAATPLLLLAGPAGAQISAPPWFNGKWNCSLDGVAGQMFWGYGQGLNDKAPANAPCDGSECSITSDNTAPYGGRFESNGVPVTYLTVYSQNATAFTMSTQRGNIWLLQQAGDPRRVFGRATYGDGSSKPLECTRPGVPTPRELSQVPGNPQAAIASSYPGSYSAPRASDGMPLDWCLRFGDNSSCGKEAADAFCASKGYRIAADFKGYTIEPATTTVSGATCTKGACWAFVSIACQS